MIPASLAHRLTMLEVKYARMLREEITPAEYAEERIKAEQAIADAIRAGCEKRGSTACGDSRRTFPRTARPSRTDGSVSTTHASRDAGSHPSPTGSSRPRPSTERRTLVQGEEGAGMEDMGGRRAQLRIPSQGADSLSTQPTNESAPDGALRRDAGDDAGAMGALVPTTEDTRRSA